MYDRAGKQILEDAQSDLSGQSEEAAQSRVVILSTSAAKGVALRRRMLHLGCTNRVYRVYVVHVGCEGEMSRDWVLIRRRKQGKFLSLVMNVECEEGAIRQVGARQ